MALRFFFFVCLVGALVPARLRGQAFSLQTRSLEIAAVPSMNHAPVIVPIAYAPANYDYTKLTLTSDATWVKPSFEPSSGNLVLTFASGNLINRTYTATVTVSDGVLPVQLTVKATVSVMNLVALQADPTRSRVYGLQQDGANAGCVVIFDPHAGVYVGNITVGEKPTDLVVRSDGGELLVVCSVSQKIYAIDLERWVIREIIALPGYTDADPRNTSAHVAYGPGDAIYYSDGAWSPALRVLGRASGTVRQMLATCGSSTSGFGDFVVSADQQSLFCWAQYSWSSGAPWNSRAVRYTIGSDGKLTLAEESSSEVSGRMQNDPLNAPALISYDGAVLAAKQFVFQLGNLAEPRLTAARTILSISPGAELFATSASIHDGGTGEKLLDLTPSGDLQAITHDYAKLVQYNAVSRVLVALDLPSALAATSFRMTRSPAEAKVVRAPKKLHWVPRTGTYRYRVFLGTSRTTVSEATTASAAFLGETSYPAITLAATLSPGTTYYWRVDAVAANVATTGEIFSFSVTSIESDLAQVTGATVQVDRKFAVPIRLTSATAGRAWKAASAAPWVSFSASAGATPAALTVFLDASQLTPGSNRATIEITADDGTFSIPVELQVDPLKVTSLRSSPRTTKVYAISEDTSAVAPRAYLLEIDALAKAVKRVVAVGSSATDLAVHAGDGRIYVINWKGNRIVAVNRTSFAVERTYALTAANNSVGGVYRLSAGGAGRLVLEAANDAVALSLFDTGTGKVISKSGTGLGSGGGGSDPTGRYYYHGGGNSTGAMLHKIDLSGDVFTEVGVVSIAGVSLFGSATVVVSEDGKRIFWNGGAFDSTLAVEWLIGDEIGDASTDGRLAFSATKVYDVAKKGVLASYAGGRYNSATNRLVLQKGGAIEFSSIAEIEAFGPQRSPSANSIVLAPDNLQWTPFPEVTGYRVYLGTSLDAVTRATVSSLEYLGQVESASMSVSGRLVTGTTYYWRVDPLTAEGEAIKGEVTHFTVSVVVPTVPAVDAGTVRGHANYMVPIGLSSRNAGLSWSASSPAEWVKFGAGSGATPSTLEAFLDAGTLAPGRYESTITVTVAGGSLSIPVKLQVDALVVTKMQSDPNSGKVYAISETTSTDGIRRAYLLEIDSALERITRVARAGSFATDLAVHPGDKRIYVTNWKAGVLLAFDRELALAEQHPFPHSSFEQDFLYRVAAGGPGRVIAEQTDQWVYATLYDTVRGRVLSKAFFYAGDGAYAPDQRYYFHGESGTSGDALIKYDTAADTFSQVAKVATSAYSSSGTGALTITEDGRRVFWKGVAFTAQLAIEWQIGDAIFAASADGRFAIGAAKIYDLNQRKVIYGLPASGAVCAFNSSTGKLVLQNGETIHCYGVDPMKPLPTPALTATASSSTSVVLTWAIDSLQTGFTLQMRVAGAAEWTDVTSSLAPSILKYKVDHLTPDKTYEFRLKADSGATNSNWSTVASVTPPSAASHLANIATRAFCGAGSGVTIGGFVVSGGASKRVLVRAVGPSLTAQGIGAGEVLLDPTIEVHDAIHGNSVVATNDNWAANANAYEMDGVTRTVGAAALLASDAKSSAALLTLAPGVYTFVVSGKAGTSGVVLLEVYDADSVSTGSTFVNIATRAQATTGNGVTIGGFVISGNAPKHVLLRAVGPTLAKQGLGVAEILADPTIELHDASHGNAIVATNDNWGDNTNAASITTTGARIGATPFDQADTKSAALLVTLQPGVYSFIASGKAAAPSGIVLVEVYDAD